MATLGGIDLGVIDKDDDEKDSGLFNQPLPRTDSNKSILADLMGVNRSFSISGVKVMSTKAELVTWVKSIQALVNGKQPGYSFIGDFDPTPVTVCIQSFLRSWGKGETISVSYNLKLLQGHVLLSGS